MRRSSLPQPGEQIPLGELGPGEELTVYRVVKTDDRDDPAFVDCFRSHEELEIPPRQLEVSHPAIYSGISAFERRAAAAETAVRVPFLGGFVAAIPLDRVEGATYYYFWGARGHLTVWSDAVKLSEAAVDILPVALLEHVKGSPIRGLHDSG